MGNRLADYHRHALWRFQVGNYPTTRIGGVQTSIPSGRGPVKSLPATETPSRCQSLKRSAIRRTRLHDKRPPLVAVTVRASRLADVDLDPERGDGLLLVSNKRPGLAILTGERDRRLANRQRRIEDEGGRGIVG